MTDQEILSHIDHTILKAAAVWGDIETLCKQAAAYKTASVCIPPSYIKPVRAAFGDKPPVATVIGFPLGYSVSSVKIAEAEQAVKDGADEVDMVINLGDVKNGNDTAVRAEIAAIKKAMGGVVLKVIVETCYLTEAEKIRLCGIVTEAGADYIKTSTGFGTQGAVMEDIELFKKHIGPNVKIKAAGGIKTREDMERFLAAGCDRLGTSSATIFMK
jgi:deoxyribose-phosphate aldolase